MIYKSILKKGKDEFEVKKSIFIGYSAPVESEEEALEFIREIKEKHKDATHNCSAYIIGKEKLIQRFDDDGEPSGTAGIPMLEVLKREDLTNIAIVATRYFGGTLLGGGGLIRAYSKTAKIAVDAGLIVDMSLYHLVDLNYDYVFHGKILNFIENNNYKILAPQYTDKVNLKCIISSEKYEDFSRNIQEITIGEGYIYIIDDLIKGEIDGELISDE